MAPRTRGAMSTPAAEEEPPPFCDWDQLPNDELAVVFGSLNKLSDLRRARCVCKAWSAAAEQESVWEALVVRIFPRSEHEAFYSAIEALGVNTWKARCRLLVRNNDNAPVMKPEKGWGLSVLRNEYTVFTTVSDGHGHTASSPAFFSGQTDDEFYERIGHTHWPTIDADHFSIAALFPSPVHLDAGAEGAWLLDDDSDEPAYGFGTVKIDVFAKRNRDGKVAHIIGCAFDIGFPDDESNDEFSVGGNDESLWLYVSPRDCTTPTWLEEHVNDVYPNLTGQPTPRGIRPEWCVNIEAYVERPNAEEGHDNPKSGKWLGFILGFEWPRCDNRTKSVENDFIAQALAGRAIDWI